MEATLPRISNAITKVREWIAKASQNDTTYDTYLPAIKFALGRIDLKLKWADLVLASLPWTSPEKKVNLGEGTKHVRLGFAVARTEFSTLQKSMEVKKKDTQAVNKSETPIAVPVANDNVIAIPARVA